MCTLIIARDLPEPGTLLVGANRDERPERASAAPVVLNEAPRVVGGRDLVAGGTWLAVREARAVVAVLNRHDPAAALPARARRSRGLLALDVATAPEADADGTIATLGAEARATLERMTAPGLARVALARAYAALGADVYAPFSLVFATAAECWLLSLGADGVAHARAVPPGWHVITHADLDARDEPRTAWLARELAGFAPPTLAAAEDRVAALLRSHGGGGAAGDAPPPVCLHHGVMRTVSSSLVTLEDRGGRAGARLRHVNGRPCEHPLVDHTALLAATPREPRG